jgi:hypothetical protein
MRLALWLLAALGLLTLASTLLPQVPAAMDEAGRAAWLRLAEQRYGALYGPLRALGLFELHNSPGLATLMVVLTVNTALCTVNRLRTLGRMLRTRRAYALGTMLTHLSLVALFLSLALSRSHTWQESVLLHVGQTHLLERTSGMLLRHDGFRIVRDAQGQPTDYAAQLTILSGDRVLRTGEVQPNRPLRAAGMGVWWVSYQLGVRVNAVDSAGQPVAVATALRSYDSGQASLNLEAGPMSATVPASALVLHVSRVSESETGQAFFLEAWQSGSSAPLLAERVPVDQAIRVGDLHLTLVDEPWVIYRVKNDPASLPLLVSALALILGSSLSLFFGSWRTV